MRSLKQRGQSLVWCLTILAACSGDGGAPGSLIVQPGTVARVTVTPPTLSLAIGTTGQLVAAALDASDSVLGGRPMVWSSSNNAVATVSNSGGVTAVGAGVATITATTEGKSGSSQVTVSGSIPLGNVIDVNSGVTYQTITGWSAAGQNGWFDCNPTAFANYKNQLNDRLINELGIDRVTTALRSGTENTRDYHKDLAAGLIDDTQYKNGSFTPVNDNADPFVTDPSKFHWARIDGVMDNTILPLRQRLQARGEQLYFVLTYVDFIQQGVSKPFVQMKQPEEYAELALAAFQHLKAKYGFAPDALELVLEPEHTTLTPTEIGRAMVATVRRLRGAGFNPAIIGPSTTSMTNASIFYDQMIAVPGAAGLLTELSYHRYVGVTLPALQAIGSRALRDNVKTSMLEHIGSGFADLYEDLTVGRASAWMQFSLAFCGNKDNPDNNGVYYQINQTNPASPKINITHDSKLFRQVFAYVRRGAVRLGAVSGSPTDLLPLAFRNVNGKQVVVVWAKRGASFSVRGLPAGTYGINFGTAGAQWNVDLPNQTIGANGLIQTSIPQDGVITIYGR